MKYREIRKKQREVIDSYVAEIGQLIPSELSNSDLRLAIYTFYLVIGKNFVPWLAMTHNNCGSYWAKRHCRENLLLEITEDHWAMLTRFIAGLNLGAKLKKQARQRARKCEPILEKIDSMVRSSASQGLLLIAALEAVSFLNMGWLQSACRQLSVRDREYVTVHLEQDEAHAAIFYEALDHELSSKSPSPWAKQVLENPITAQLVQLHKTLLGGK